MLNCKDCIVECYDSCEINVREKALRNKPKEDTMPAIRKPIFESEEEYDSIIKIMGFVVPHNHKERAQTFGLIRRDPVEEAEKMYRKHYEINGHISFSVDQQKWGDNSREALNVIRKQHEAIQHMKPYYEKYKGEQQ